MGWGNDDPSFRRVFAMQFMPEGSYELWEEFAALQRRTTSSANAVRYMQSYSEIDIAAIRAKVVAPTLVLHTATNAGSRSRRVEGWPPPFPAVGS